jgi:hypothetical protein
MARRELILTHFVAEYVLFPRDPLDETPRGAVRVTVFGPTFPERAVQPELLVGDSAATQVSIARDGTSIRGYFHQLPADGALVRVRYGDSQEGVLDNPFRSNAVRPLPQDCWE